MPILINGYKGLYLRDVTSKRDHAENAILKITIMQTFIALMLASSIRKPKKPKK